MAKKKFDVIVSVGGRTVTYQTEAESAKTENLGNGMLRVGDVEVREGALIGVFPSTGKQQT